MAKRGICYPKYTRKEVFGGYSPEQLYAAVAAVYLYDDFLPWCRRSEIIRHHPDGSLDAELEIGFKFLIGSYVFHVELNKSKSVKVENHFQYEGSLFLVFTYNTSCLYNVLSPC
ncbi:Hypothetical predicted protein [Olea europaea subsp. europaea]|uniref:Coenzyme Q-binding protein COQ10 START domain-containing protein n=1 Tax=Olea europaea subsp. europaea TaxID=158383 RepID=A0A8S0VJL6_OLEEU|nr:Hypothetical predicted protein [Olea europaea subsp. europaea]